jgi:hypothetical protein
MQETVSEPEGLSFEPSQWRDYMLDRLSNDGTSSTPSASASSTSLASDGNTTPIMAASPAGQDQPLLSPDSLLDPMEEEQRPPLFPAAAACPECEQKQQMSAERKDEDLEKDQVDLAAVEDELELVVEITNSNDGESNDVIVASMGRVGEATNSDIGLDSKVVAAVNSDGEPLDEAADVAESQEVGEPLANTESESSEETDAACSAVGGAAPLPEEEGESSESEYAKEEEQDIRAEDHLMADVQFSQQKLQELLSQLGKEDRFAVAASASAADQGGEQMEVPQNSSAAAVTETESPPAVQVAPAESKETTPERRLSGDNEISDHIDRAKLRKCSSLKSGRTPPGTPGVRKIVR